MAVKILLVGKRGGLRHVRLGWPGVLVGLLLVLAVGPAAGIHCYRWLHPNSQTLDVQLLAQWRRQLSGQDAKLRQIEHLAAMESGAVGRQLARMQARLWRMEALGERVVDAVEIDGDEFDFAAPAAQGGSASHPETPLEWRELRTHLDALAKNLRRRESELQVLESILSGRERRAAAAPAGRPIRKGWISSPYGERVDPFSGKMSWHFGVDFAGRQGADVIAVADGVVVHAGPWQNFGNMVEIDHGDGYVTRYAHHEALSIAAGEIVKRGQKIASMGSSGRSTGPHVHFEVLKDGRHVNPARYVERVGS